MSKKSSRHTVVPRTMCLVFLEDKILLIRASDKKEFHGYYDPPGGHIEKGESIVANAEKEILEETGLNVAETRLRGVVHVSGFYGKNIMLFVTSSVARNGRVKESKEGVPEWIDIDKLNSVKLLEDVKPIIKHVVEMSNDQMFFGVSEFDGKDKLVSFDIRIH